MEHLVKFNAMKNAIAEAHGIDEIKLIRDKAEAYRYALIQAKESPEYIRKAEEIKLRAEYRAGEVLKEIELQHGARGIGKKVESKPTTSLSELDITRDQSSKWQKIASIPENKFEKYIEAQKEITTSGAINLSKRLKRENEIEEIKQNITEVNINGLYDVIIVDPPWQYGAKYNPDARRVTSPYPEMSIEDIKYINIPAEDDCILWLWTTHKFIWDAKEILKYWGFEYKAIMVWDKEKMGIGHWLRMQCEFCLLGIKGNPIWDIKDLKDIIREPRREHSRKPETFYNMIRNNFAGKKCDYFSREKRDDFEQYGNEQDRF